MSWFRGVSWYRVLPMSVVAVFGIIAAVWSYAPAPLLRDVYPLSYEASIRHSSAQHDIDPYLVAAVIKTESNWIPSCVSNKGAQGLMQIMPGTARDMIKMGKVDRTRYSETDLDDPATNIEFGCAYLSYLIAYFHGSTERAVAAYNAGMGKVNDWAEEDTTLHNAITYPETQAYLLRVYSARGRYVDLYPNRFLA